MMFPRAPEIDTGMVFVIVKYVIFFHILMRVVYELVMVDDWLAKFCSNNRDAGLYQLGSPP